MTARLVRAQVTTDPLDTAALAAEVVDDRCGAILTFEGVVRNHDHGEPVTTLDYSAHPQADEIIGQIAGDFLDREGIHAVSVCHRVGPMGIGDVAMVAVVAAEHRGQGFTTLSDLVDAVKERLPIWKKQSFTEGGHEWVGLPQ